MEAGENGVLSAVLLQVGGGRGEEVRTERWRLELDRLDL